MSLPRPEPSAGLAAYRAELSACLALNPQTRENWDRYQASNRRSAVVDYLPVKLDVENVSRCNFSCSMCAVSKWPKRKRAEDMCLHEFKALIDEQVGLVEIKLNGLGEALMQGDDYFDMIRYARARRIWVRMTTNASLLGVNDNTNKLIDSGVNEIDISIDGATAKVFEGIRVGGKFRIVTQNSKLLNEALAIAGKPSAKMWTLVQRANYMHLTEHVVLAAELGFKQLVFSMNLHGWGDRELEKRNKAVTVDSLVRDREYRHLVTFGTSKGVRVAFWDVNAKFDTDEPEHLCSWPFERAVVTSDSRTVICCMVGDPNAHEIGPGKTFLQNWTGDEYRAFRQAHIDGNIPKPCKGCYKIT